MRITSNHIERRSVRDRVISFREVDTAIIGIIIRYVCIYMLGAKFQYTRFSYFECAAHIHKCDSLNELPATAICMTTHRQYHNLARGNYCTYTEFKSINPITRVVFSFMLTYIDDPKIFGGGHVVGSDIIGRRVSEILFRAPSRQESRVVKPINSVQRTQ